MLGADGPAAVRHVPEPLAEAVRELLLAVRALIDWYLDRLEQAARPSKGGGGERVEDIPIA